MGFYEKIRKDDSSIYMIIYILLFQNYTTLLSNRKFDNHLKYVDATAMIVKIYP